MKLKTLADEIPVEVMFVERDPAVSDMYRLKLELDGYRVTVVNSREAVARAGDRRPDLVFLELPTDQPEGMAVLRRLRARAGCEQLPAVVLVDGGEAELRAHGIELGPCDYPVRIGPVRSLSDPWPLSA